ncbi:MAG: PfkB family carbohydrate kinase [Candidatus Hadarchaeales archaeon]
MRKYDVLGIGTTAVDIVYLLNGYPVLGMKKRAIDFSIQGGGLIGTSLVTLARLGAKVAYAGKLGEDYFSKFLVDEFRRENVDVFLEIDKDFSPVIAVVLVDKSTGERTIVWREQSSPIELEDIDLKLIGRTKIIHLDCVSLKLEDATEVAKKARDENVKVSLDVEVLKPKMDDLLKLVNFLIVPQQFSYSLTGEKDVKKACRKMMSRYENDLVCITMGERGCYCSTPDESFYQPAFKVKVVDTTGCGDVFHGAFLYGVINNWNPRKIARFASAAAALKCRKLGGRAGIPTLSEVESFLRNL